MSESVFLAHLKFGCRCTKTLKHMSSLQIMKNMNSLKTSQLHKLKCPICAIMKVPCVTSNINNTKLNLAPGQMFHIDFAFVSETSIRGFSIYLSFLYNTTGCLFYFLARKKRSPLDIFQSIISTLCQKNKSINYVRYDKVGEFVRSSEVKKLPIENNIMVQST